MTIHKFLDNLTITISAPMLGRSKYFRQSVQSQTLDEHLAAIRLELPPIDGEGVLRDLPKYSYLVLSSCFTESPTRPLHRLHFPPN
jgi:hypothetical protein